PPPPGGGGRTRAAAAANHREAGSSLRSHPAPLTALPRPAHQFPDSSATQSMVPLGYSSVTVSVSRTAWLSTRQSLKPAMDPSASPSMLTCTTVPSSLVFALRLA